MAALRSLAVFLFLAVEVCVSHDWSSSSLVDNAVHHECSGNTVWLTWDVALGQGESIENILWLFKGREAIATSSHGFFFASPAYLNRVTSLSGLGTANAGIALNHVTSAEQGSYSVDVTGQANGTLFIMHRTVTVHIVDCDWHAQVTTTTTTTTPKPTTTTPKPITRIPWPPQSGVPYNKNTFHDTGHILWKDCGDSNTSVRVTNLDLTPKPLHIPGNGTFTLHASNGFTTINGNVALRVDIKKHLLGTWSTIPCTGSPSLHNLFGSCTYPEPCRFSFRWWFPDGVCPRVLSEQGLSCTCPFTIPAHKQVNINNEVFTLPPFPNNLSWLSVGEYYIKVAMYEQGSSIARMCLETYLTLNRF